MNVSNFTLNDTLGAFREFADSPKATRSQLAKELKIGSAPEAQPGVAPRSLSKHERNNELRKLFYRQISSLYPNGIPQNIKDVMKLRDYGEMVPGEGVANPAFNTGKKLSHKRVDIVLTAVQRDLALTFVKTSLVELNKAAKSGNTEAAMACMKEIANKLFGMQDRDFKSNGLARLNDIAVEFAASGRDLCVKGDGSQRFCAAVAQFTKLIFDTARELGKGGHGESDLQRNFRDDVTRFMQNFVLNKLGSEWMDTLYTNEREAGGEDGVRKFLEKHFNAVFGWSAKMGSEGRLELGSRMNKVDRLVHNLVKGDGNVRSEAAQKLKRIYTGFANKYIGDEARRNRVTTAFCKFVDDAFPSETGLQLDRDATMRLQDIARYAYGSINVETTEQEGDEGFICNTKGFTCKLTRSQYEGLSDADKAQFRQASKDMKGFLLKLSRKCDAATRSAIRDALNENAGESPSGLLSCKTVFKVYELLKGQVQEEAAAPLQNPMLDRVGFGDNVGPTSLLRNIIGRLADEVAAAQDTDYPAGRLSGDEKSRFGDYLDCFVDELKRNFADVNDDKLVGILKQKVELLYCLSKAEKMGSDGADVWHSPIYLPLVNAKPQDRAAHMPVGALLQMAAKGGDSAKLAARLLAYGECRTAIAFLASTKDEDVAKFASGDSRLSRERVLNTICPGKEKPANFDQMPISAFLTEKPDGVIYNAYNGPVVFDGDPDPETMMLVTRATPIRGFANGLVLAPDLADDIVKGKEAEFTFNNVKAAFGLPMSEIFKQYPTFNDVLDDLNSAQRKHDDGDVKWKETLRGELKVLFEDVFRNRPTVKLFNSPGDTEADRKEFTFADDNLKTEEDLLTRFIEMCKAIDKLKWSENEAVASKQKIGALMLMGQAALSTLNGIIGVDNKNYTIELVNGPDKEISVVISNKDSEDRHFELDYTVNKFGRNKVSDILFRQKGQKKAGEYPPLELIDLGSDVYGRDAQNRPSGIYKLKYYDNTGKYYDDINDRYDAQREDPTWADVLAGKVKGSIVSVRNDEEDLAVERDIRDVVNEEMEILSQPNEDFRKGILDCLRIYAKESEAFVGANATVPQKEAFLAFVTEVEGELRFGDPQSLCAFGVKKALQKYAGQMPAKAADDLKAWMNSVEEALVEAGDTVPQIEEKTREIGFGPSEDVQSDVLVDYDTQIRAGLANRVDQLKARLGTDFNGEIIERCYKRVLNHLPGELRAALVSEELEGTPEEKIKKVFEDNADILDVIYSPDVAKAEYYNFDSSASVHTVDFIRRLMTVGCPSSIRNHLAVFGFDNDTEFNKLLSAAAARLLATQGGRLGTLEEIKKDVNGLIGSAFAHLGDQLTALAKACGYVAKNNGAGDGNVNEFTKQIITTPLGRQCVREFFGDEKPFEADKPFDETENAELSRDDGNKYRELKRLYDENAMNRLVNDVQHRFETKLAERRKAIAESAFANSPAVKELNGILNELRLGGLQDSLKVPQADLDRLTERINAYLNSRQSVAERGMVGYNVNLRVAELETDSNVAALKAEYQQLLKKYAKNGLDVNVNEIKKSVLRNLPGSMLEMAGNDRLLTSVSEYVAEAAFNSWVAERKAAWGDDEDFNLEAESAKALEYVRGKLDGRMANDVKRLVTVSAEAMAGMGMKPLDNVFAGMLNITGEDPETDMVRSLMKALADRLDAADTLDDGSAKAIFEKCYEECFVAPNRSAAEKFLAVEENVGKLAQELVSANKDASTMNQSARTELVGELVKTLTAHLKAYAILPHRKSFAEFLEGLKDLPDLEIVFKTTSDVQHRLAFSRSILAHEDAAMSNAARLEFLDSDMWKNFVTSKIGMDGVALETLLGKLRDLSADFEPKNILEAYRRAAQTDWASLNIANSDALMPTILSTVGQLTDCYQGLKDICGAFVPEKWFPDAEGGVREEGEKLETFLNNAIIAHLNDVLEQARKDAVENHKPFAYKEVFTTNIVSMMGRVSEFGGRVTAIANDIREALVAVSWLERKSWPEGKDLSPALLNDFLGELRGWMQALVQGSEDPIASNSTKNEFAISDVKKRKAEFSRIINNDPNKPATGLFSGAINTASNFFGGWFGKKK